MDKGGKNNGLIGLLICSILLRLLTILAILWLIVITAKNAPKNEIKGDKVETLSIDTHLSVYALKMPNKGDIYDLMDILSIEHRDIVYAQMLLESGRFESSISKSNNNFFGMKHPKKRKTVSLGSKNGYASYESWAHSVYDYRLWQEEFGLGLTDEEYLALLQSKYAEDVNYSHKLRKIIKN